MSIPSNENGQKAEVFNSLSHSLPLILKQQEEDEESKLEPNSDKGSEFWKQPDGLGYRPCLDFSRDYEKASVGTVKDRTKYLMVVVAGGLNQQRNQIVDAVVIARILGAALVVPILQVNVIWGDERCMFLT